TRPGWTGSGCTVGWRRRGSRATWWTRPLSLARSADATPKPTGSMGRSCCAAWLRGEAGVCSMVVPPSVAQEDIRRLSRERGQLVAERTKLSNRVGGLLANQGIAGFKPLKKGARQALQTLRTGDGRELPPHLRTTIERILQRLELLSEQIKAAEAERDAMLRAARVDAAPDTAPDAATAASPEMAAAPLLLR